MCCLSDKLADDQIGGLLFACSAQRAHSQENHRARYLKQATCKTPKWASAINFPCLTNNILQHLNDWDAKRAHFDLYIESNNRGLTGFLEESRSLVDSGNKTI